MNSEFERLLVSLLQLWVTALGCSAVLYGLGYKRAPVVVVVAPFRFVGWILSGILTAFGEAAVAVGREALRMLRAVGAAVARAMWDTFRTIVGIVGEYVSAGVAAAHQYYYGRYPRATAGVYSAAAFAAGVTVYFYLW